MLALVDMHCDVSCLLQYRQKHAFSMYTNYILGRSSADNWMPQAKVFFEVGTEGARGQPSRLANAPPYPPGQEEDAEGQD